jgi:DNA adenine methylase
MMRSPIKWVGGKSRLRSRIIDLLPEHSCYVEPFCGAAWVLFGKKPSDVEIINDINGELMNFFRIVRDNPEQFIESFTFELIAREEFERQAALDPADLNDIERAHRFFYIIMASWGGELDYPRFQTSIKDGGHGNRLIGATKRLRQRIEPVHQRLQTVIIENLDWRECIDRYDRDGVVMYIDPPYPGNGANYEHNMRDWHEHQELADRLQRSRCKWILSSYDNDEIRRIFPDQHVYSVSAASGMQQTKQTSERVIIDEVLILNYEVEEAATEMENPIQQARLMD